MRLPANTIWDTRIQCICAVVTARGEQGVEAFLSANFAQVSLDPPRIAINPNRLYPIEQAIRAQRYFAINVLPENRLAEARAVNDIRRRQPNKTEVLGLAVEEGMHSIPYLPIALQTLFCEVESVLDTGDHALIVARVLGSLRPSAGSDERPLTYPLLTGGGTAARLLRRALNAVGALDLLRWGVARLRGPSPPPDLPRNTYLAGGQTDREVETVLAPGAVDTSRIIVPGRPLPVLRTQTGVCVVGGGWGMQHAEFVRRAAPDAKLFLCGRDAARISRQAARLGATGWFTDLEQAAADPRVDALILALPHDMHRRAVEIAAAHGKHVLVEKPIATTLEDADAMIAAAERAGTILMVAEDMHFRPAVREALHQIELGLIGEPVYLLVHIAGVRRPTGWQSDPARAGGGVWMDQGVHYVRAVRLLMGEPDRILATRGMQVHTKGEVEDSLQVVLSSRFGWQTNLFASWLADRGPLPDIIVHGEKGVLHLYPGRDHIEHFPNAPTGWTTALSYVRPYALQDKLRRPWQQRRRIPLVDEDLTGYVHEVREFLSAVAGQRPVVTPATDARRDLEIVLAGYRSLTAENWTEV